MTSMWAHEGGGSLILVAPGIDRAGAFELAVELDKLAVSFDVAIEHGIEHVVDEVRRGVLGLAWLEPHAVFVFRCPRTFAINEAAPLLQTGVGMLSRRQMESALAVILGVARLSLRRISRVGFAYAHAWDPDDDVRFESGTLPEFESFLRSPSAWSWQFLGTGREYFSVVRDENPFWFEVRRS